MFSMFLVEEKLKVFTTVGRKHTRFRHVMILYTRLSPFRKGAITQLVVLQVPLSLGQKLLSFSPRISCTVASAE